MSYVCSYMVQDQLLACTMPGCKSRYTLRRNLLRHIREGHIMAYNQVVSVSTACLICPHIYTMQDQLVACTMPGCKKWYTARRNLVRHMRQDHNVDNRE